MTRIVMEHIAWARRHNHVHRFELSDSAIATPDLEALGLPHGAGLPAEGYALQPRLEEALGARLGAPGGRVRVAAGASEANACVYGALLEPGDEVLVERPGYEPHRAVPELFGARAIAFPRSDTGAGGSAAALTAAIEAALTGATRMIVISDLNNPTGAELGEPAARALDALAGRHGLWIHCDETFRDASRRPPGTAAARSPRWVTTSSLTKSYGLGGLRLGWIAGASEVLERCVATQNAFSAQPSLPSIALALALVPHLDALRARARGLLDRNHARFRDALPRLEPLRAAGPPSGTTAWCMVGADALGDRLSEHALERHDLALAPGRFFGDPRGVRVALGSDPERFGEALAVLERAVADFAAARASA
jgi:aspartate/methionine/tyrosine aminotransferase